VILNRSSHRKPISTCRRTHIFCCLKTQ
jgi:hypothetical protein